MHSIAYDVLAVLGNVVGHFQVVKTTLYCVEIIFTGSLPGLVQLAYFLPKKMKVEEYICSHPIHGLKRVLDVPTVSISLARSTSTIVFSLKISLARLVTKATHLLSHFHIYGILLVGRSVCDTTPE